MLVNIRKRLMDFPPGWRESDVTKYSSKKIHIFNQTLRISP